MPNDALEYLSRLFRCAPTRGAYLDASFILPAVVDDLQVMLARLVDRERRAVVDSPRLADVVRPLIAIIGVSVGELVVILPRLARRRFPVLTVFEALFSFFEDVFGLHQFIHEPSTTGALRFTGGFITSRLGRVRPGNSSVSTQIHASARLGERSPV